MPKQVATNGPGEDRKLARYWCAVASREHVKRGVAGGFAQAGHGKKGPLSRMKPLDGIVYYSPTDRMGKSGQKCQMFTSIGLVKDGSIYPVEMSLGFTAYRRDVEYFEAEDAPIQPLLQDLSFTRERKSWGYMFRFGLFEIERDDFVRIFAEMNPAACAELYGSPR
ncbi:MAG TPA: EVE domain-containing protein [Pyrinomonadaceae bacterium]|jgi:hypothetical protein